MNKNQTTLYLKLLALTSTHQLRNMNPGFGFVSERKVSELPGLQQLPAVVRGAAGGGGEEGGAGALHQRVHQPSDGLAAGIHQADRVAASRPAQRFV